MTRLRHLLAWCSSISGIWIALALLGSAVLAVSMSAVSSSKAAMLGIIFGGVLLQASIISFALRFGQEKPRPRRRRHGVETAASRFPRVPRAAA
jgi:hypothetical protein